MTQIFKIKTLNQILLNVNYKVTHSLYDSWWDHLIEKILIFGCIQFVNDKYWVCIVGIFLKEKKTKQIFN